MNDQHENAKGIDIQTDKCSDQTNPLILNDQIPAQGEAVAASSSSLPAIEQDKDVRAKRQNSKDPLHGVTLEQIVTKLVERFGWSDLGDCIRIRCFNSDPSIKSSLTFLRKTPWARKKVENLYINECL